MDSIIILIEFIEKLHGAYQALLSGTYRPGQIVVAVPTLSTPVQHKSQQSQNAGHETSQVNSGDGVDVHSFLEAALQIIHTSNGTFRYILYFSCFKLVIREWAKVKSVDKNQNFILSNTEKQKWYHANLLPSWRPHYKSLPVMVLSGTYFTFLLLTCLLTGRPKVKTKEKIPNFSFCSK